MRHRRGGAADIRQGSTVKLRFTRRATGPIGKVIGDLVSPSPRSAASISRRISDLLDLPLQFPLPAAERRGAACGAFPTFTTSMIAWIETTSSLSVSATRAGDRCPDRSTAATRC
jgi:hypothetical protein